MTANADDQPVSRRVLDQAIDWQLRLDGNDAAELAAHRTWLAAHPDHARAWRQLASLDAELVGLPAQAPVRAALGRARRKAGWKTASRPLALLLAIGLGAAVLDRHQPVAGLLADYRSGTGERRTVTLPDNTVIVLNARSAVDLEFDENTRAIRLRDGEIHIHTAHADPSEQRPFVVLTAQGSLHALGTRFIVRRDGDTTWLTVTESAVLARPASCPPDRASACAAERRVEAGRQLRLGDGATGEIQPAAPEADAWTDGMLILDGEPLAAVAARLARYRPGLLRVAPEVADLRVTGTLPLDDGDRALAALAASLPVRIVQHGGWLVRIEARHAQE
ncbi:DUF4880 domain-containing protein [Pseudothauera nasutitermitis]|uniref:DUF4880 domain-containing protein n=1 Tax=Pseudothauera nasutitermitis TaxID=2565930 RepID=A0A4S4ASV9_9RHOO|nr:FecR domain-containing protein [Pseudothauera nasutitermitis]THF62932.1 DUF4880 domain-containing protein [Pseudothauera nasutitermitis]